MYSMPPIKIPNVVIRMAESHRTQKYFLPVSFFTLHLRRVYRSSILQKSMCSEPMQAPVRPPAIKIIALRDGPDILLFGVLYVVFHYSHHNSAQADVLEFANLWASSKLALASSPESRMALFRIEIESPRAEGPSLLRWHQMSNRAQ